LMIGEGTNEINVIQTTMIVIMDTDRLADPINRLVGPLLLEVEHPLFVAVGLVLENKREGKNEDGTISFNGNLLCDCHCHCLNWINTI